MEGILSKVGFAVCHQLPEHTLSCGGRLMPLCARCTGIYAGIFLTALLLLALGRFRSRRLPPAPAIILGLGFLAAMAGDVTTALLAWRETDNAFRLATGALVGTTIPALGLPLANSIVREEGEDRARILSFGEFGLISMVVLALSFMVRIRSLFLFQTFSLISVLGLVLFMMGMNSLPLAGFFGRKRIPRIVSGSLILTIGELVLLTNLHRWLLRTQGLG